jgi:hypothetical protein
MLNEMVAIQSIKFYFSVNLLLVDFDGKVFPFGLGFCFILYKAIYTHENEMFAIETYHNFSYFHD